MQYMCVLCVCVCVCVCVWSGCVNACSGCVVCWCACSVRGRHRGRFIIVLIIQKTNLKFILLSPDRRYFLESNDRGVITLDDPNLKVFCWEMFVQQKGEKLLYKYGDESATWFLQKQFQFSGNHFRKQGSYGKTLHYIHHFHIGSISWSVFYW